MVNNLGSRNRKGELGFGIKERVKDYDYVVGKSEQEKKN